MTDFNEKARQAARSVFLTVIARLLSVITPIILGPMVWLLFDLKDTNSALKVRVEVLERAESRREQDSRQITNRRDDQISEIVQRLARVETQGAAVVEALNRLADRLDRQQRRGDLLPGYRLKAAKE